MFKHVTFNMFDHHCFFIYLSRMKGFFFSCSDA